MDPRNNIATDLFYKIRSRFSGLKLGTETGEITILPQDARFFDFDYMEGEMPLGHVSISLAEPNSMKIYFSHGITESMDNGQKNNWYKFLKEMRLFAKRRLLNFDTRDIAKDNLDQRDYAFLSQVSTKPSTVGESIMKESTMYGTKTVSYQKLLDTRLIIKHNQAVMDDTQPGARTRHISALFVENQEGERFKYPFIHLAGARAMQRHVANNGLPYDEIGKSIIGMSEEIAQLRSFGNYVVRNDLMNSVNNGIVERSTSYLNSLREQIKKLAGQKYYEQYKESFQTQQPVDIPDDIVKEFTEQFTVKSFKEDIKSVFPVLYRLMKEDNSVDYNDIISMDIAGQSSANEQITAEDIDQDQYAEIDTTPEPYDPVEAFETWVMNLGEESAITSSDPDEQAAALQELQELVSQEFTAGVDGTNATQSLKGIIDDLALMSQIKEQAKTNPEVDVRSNIYAWLKENAPEVLDQLDFGDYQPEDNSPTSEPDDSETDNDTDNDQYYDQEGNADEYADADAAAYGEKEEADPNKSTEKANMRELAEFIHSFYDHESKTFPKGPEGVSILVGKKFGQQAESVARKFVERMAPQQTTDNNPELQELARIKELSGINQANT